MAAELFPFLNRATNSNGSPFSGARWYFYASGTLTPQSVYTDDTLGTAHAHPVVSDSAGLFAPIYFDASLEYRGILQDGAGVEILDVDPINTDVLSTLAASGGSALIGFLQAGSGATARTAQAKMRDAVNFKDFGATGNGSTNDTTAVQNCITYAQANGLIARASGGIYLVDTITLGDNAYIDGTGTFKKRSDSETPVFNLTGSDNVTISSGITVDGNASIQTSAAARSAREPVIRCNDTGDGNTSTGIRLYCKIDNCHGRGFFGTGLIDSEFIGMRVEDCGGRGIAFASNCNNVLVQGCTVRRCFLSGIWHNGQGTMASAVGTSTNIRIIGNHVEDIDTDSAVTSSGIGIEVIGSTEPIIADNTVKTCDSMGISTGYFSNGIVANNRVETVTYSTTNSLQGFGIESAFVSNTVYSGNQITDCRVGFFVASGQDNIYTGNSFTAAEVASAPVDESYTRFFWLRGVANTDALAFGFGGPCAGHLIVGNKQRGGTHGVLIINPASDADSVDNIAIRSNHFINVLRTVWGSSTSADFNDITFEGNEIVGPYDYGGRFAYITRPRVTNNIIRAERNASCIGFQFFVCADPFMIGNQFYDLTGDAASHTSSTGTLTWYGNTKDASVGSYLTSAGYTTYVGHDNPPQRVSRQRTTSSATYNLADDDDVVLCNTTSNAINVVSQTAMRTRGKRITIKDSVGNAGTNNITFTGNGVNVDGAATSVISTNWGGLTVEFDGTRWLTV